MSTYTVKSKSFALKLISFHFLFKIYAINSGSQDLPQMCSVLHLTEPNE